MRRKIVTAGAVALSLALGLGWQATAQSLELGQDEIRINNSNGDAQSLLKSAFLKLGGNGAPGSFELQNSSGGLHLQSIANNHLTQLFGGLTLGPLNSLGLLPPTVVLDGVSGDVISSGGEVVVQDGLGNPAIRLGPSGDAENATHGNGFIKGWAQIDSAGNALSCYNCDADPMKTKKEGPGVYVVDFSPIAGDISFRPSLAVVNGSVSTTIGVEPDGTDSSRVRVYTNADTAFTVTVF